MKKYGLIGYPLSHSFSEKYFSKKFEKEKITDCEYNNFSLHKISDFPDLIKNTANLKGLNVTIPYKEKIIPFLDKIDKTAKQIGAVNAIKLEKKSNKTILIGYNTDVYGFRKSLINKFENRHKKALILGTGGASKAVKYVLNNLEIKYLFVSRKKTENTILYSELSREIIEQHTLIINTTPLGMFPNTEKFPDIPYNFISKKHLFYDLIYNPEKTIFLQKGKQKSAKIINGLQMLELQAEMSWEIFQ